jgi:RNA polymerase sigma factor (sigma-70 family)
MPENHSPGITQPIVFVIDDDPSVRTGLTRLLRAAGFQTEAFASIPDFLSRERHPAGGCLVLDVFLREGRSLSAREQLIEAGCHLPIVFISGYADIADSVHAMKNGAVDFLAKPIGDAELISAVHRALDQDQQERQRRAEVQSIRERIASLTAREQEVLRHVVAGKTNAQIATELGVVLSTVKAHRARVMAKMKTRTLADLVRAVEKAYSDMVDAIGL